MIKNEALIVLYCNDEVTKKVIKQESYTKIRYTHKEILTKIVDYVNSKLKAKVIVKLFFDILGSTFYNHFNIIS